MLKAALGAANDRENAVTHYDLAETPLAEVIDDARALSLFASERVIFAGNAEARATAYAAPPMMPKKAKAARPPRARWRPI